MAQIHHILSTVLAAAIRERRILCLTYVAAIEPQLFAPLALYVTGRNELRVDGYEIAGKRVRWREIELRAVRDVRQTLHTYAFAEDPAAVRKTYPPGTTVLAGALTGVAGSV